MGVVLADPGVDGRLHGIHQGTWELQYRELQYGQVEITQLELYGLLVPALAWELFVC